MILLKKLSYAGHYIKGILHCQEYCNIFVIFFVPVQPSDASCVNHAGINEHIMRLMDRTPIKPQTEAALAADSLLYRRSVACLRGVS